MPKKQFSAKTIPFAFFLITFLSYGLLIPWTGFYWDDWPFAWIARFLGPAAFIPSFSGFRPFLGPIFFITTSLIPTNPILWQTFALIIRFLAGLSAWFALNQIWPSHKRQTLITSFLFIVFPGYSQNWVAFTHINQEWIPLIFYLLSFGFTARAFRNPHRFLSNTNYALLLLVIGVFPTEYFIGLEPLRFLFIWVIISEGTKGFWPRLLKTLKVWWPYLLIWLTDAIWLIFYYKSGAYISYDVTAVQGAPVLSEAFVIFGDALWKAGLYIWAQVLVLTMQSLTTPTSLLTLALIVITFVLSCFYLLKLKFEPADAKSFALTASIIGVLGILLGRLPSFAAGLPLTLQSSFDRFMISMMLGGSLFIAGLVELLISSQRAKTYVFASLIALGIGQQFFNANIFRRDWQGQQEIYWQFAWRIPALQPDTAIITQQMPLDYETDFSMTAPLNWIYAPDIHPPDLPFAMVYSEKRLGGVVLPDLQPDTVMQLPYRTVAFHGNTSQAIVIYIPPNGCLRVFDPAFGDMETYARFSESVSAPIPLSNPARIITDSPPPKMPNPPFNREPAHTWCYFYEKAELARQTRDWNKVAQWGHQASQQGFAPQDAFEWLPFIEAYARTGDLKSAQQITRQAWDAEPKIHRGLCVLWKRLQAEGPDEAQSFASNFLREFSCGQ
ncbi:MAG: hypothetical protein M1282_06710 [Chloroflexi bacterium]|nr:hypothetical protein [Chloroflexota bacterium]